MKRLLLYVVFALLFGSSILCASGSGRSDARSWGFLGPIRAVSTTEHREKVDWRQPDGPSVTLPAGCLECEFDRDGNAIKMGQTLDEEFRGEVMSVRRDSDGHIIEKLADNAQGEIQRREVYGPYGIVEQEGFENGKPVQSAFWFYDSNGHLSGFRGYDRDGSISASSSSITSADGNSKEQWDFGPDGAFTLHFVDVTDPKADTWTFTNFNEDGSIKVYISTLGTKVISYWQVPSEKPLFGSNFYVDRKGKTQESYSCHSDSTCAHLISYSPDESSPLVQRVEWHDNTGALELAADYEYELDNFGNWIKRTVWVWSLELGERKLYETDSRTLRYWAK